MSGPYIEPLLFCIGRTVEFAFTFGGFIPQLAAVWVFSLIFSLTFSA